MRGSHRRSICGIITRRLCRARCSRLSGGNSTAGRQTAKPVADPPRGTGAPEKWSADGAAVGLCRARGAQADGGLRWVCGKRVQHGVAACAAPAVGNRILLDCMKQIVQDLPINIEVVLRQTLRAIPDLTRTERQRFCTVLRHKLYSETVYSALLDHITVTGEDLTVHLHGVSEPLYFDLSGREKPSVQRTDG